MASTSTCEELSAERAERAGGRILLALIMASLTGVLYARVLADLALDWWNEPALSYGMLVPPLAAILAWSRRDSIFAEAKRTDRFGLWIIAGACLIFLAGKLAAEFFLARISFVILLAGFVWTFWGRRRLQKLAFPFVMLATMVPLPALIYNNLSAPLQLFASGIAAQIAELVNVTVYRDGNIIRLAGMSLGVAEACSGLNSLSSLMVASLLLGFVREFSISARVVLFILAIPLSIATNVLRVAGTAILADYDQRFALGFYHSFAGWLVFMVGFGLLYGCSALIEFGSRGRKA